MTKIDTGPALAELIALLERADGPSRELDALIAAELEPHLFDAPGFMPERPIPPFTYDKGENVIRFQGGGLMDVRFFPAVTSSQDAAVALAERVLPGWTIAAIGQDDRKGWHAELREGCRTSYSTVALGGAPNGALALCLALLRAVQENRHHG
ncbi:hypothetical protein IB238_09285 [Rhizobium sp. ARZ01]|uniref:hypothetical protein n=1 Tax=Rhizobium sp. ARZ01 TaxID=2769313 RepID=UPI00178750B2|nr:hypothetical protein [Rhizobium sp. ARZ01]MBD9372811.1 hypothetical protein [Rhizobium sp. ARZ01]